MFPVLDERGAVVVGMMECQGLSEKLLGTAMDVLGIHYSRPGTK